ncbi:hypothetical protein E8E12_007765 [Didymella heteroderae]|uniref:Uncharacterized protein n=1 Tax=Didymella heteroderae TaxID=1769908 RepID=A0A9P4WWF4_9PLEO|nr:hypothetical protein E8E12_007765 [Didymella heteroderae]
MPGPGNHTRSYAVSTRSASITIAPPPASLWARRNQSEQHAGQPAFDRDTLHAADSIYRPYVSRGHYNHDGHGHGHGQGHGNGNGNGNHLHLRADSSVLGFERPRIMSKAYVASPTAPAVPAIPTIHLADRSVSPPLTPYTISEPIGPIFYPKPEDYGGCQSARPPQRLSASMPLEILPRAHWLSRVRSCLRLLIIVLSGAVVFMLVHTLGIYRGNRYLELRKGEIPMVWPAHTNLAPTIILIAVAGANFLASVAILSLSFKRSFRRPIRSRDLYRIVAGSFGVVLWAAALVVFHLLDKASKASLGRYSCTNASQITNGRYQYRAVCEEQNVAFYTAVGAAGAELLTLITLAASAIKSMREEPPLPTIQIHEKKDSNHLSSAWKPTRPKTWTQ